MSDRSAAAHHRPLSGTARHRLVGPAVTATMVTRLGARPVIADAAEGAARSPGGANG
jgi:hypothetical protein